MTIADHTMDQFNPAIYSGLYATYLYMQKAYPHLKETKGPWSTLPRAPACLATMVSAAAAAKEGIRGLTRVAANEWGKDGINVNIVCPLAWTAALRTSKMPIPRRLRPTSTCRRRATMATSRKEIGRVVVQLCGPDFKYMNGETVTLEGGMGQRFLNCLPNRVTARRWKPARAAICLSSSAA